MENAIRIMTFWEGAYKASGYFEADCMFLIVEGAYAVLEDCAHSGWEFPDIPASDYLCQIWFYLVLAENVSPAADQPESQAVY
eukprot:1162050-Pelagomonas_calceolata.AAC.5